MSYNWTNGEVITAEKLNQTGNIVMLSFTDDGLDASFNDIVAFLQQGVLPVVFTTTKLINERIVMDVLYLYSAIHDNEKYYAMFSGLRSSNIEVASVEADSPSEKMVWVNGE